MRDAFDVKISYILCAHTYIYIETCIYIYICIHIYIYSNTHVYALQIDDVPL